MYATIKSLCCCSICLLHYYPPVGSTDAHIDMSTYMILMHPNLIMWSVICFSARSRNGIFFLEKILKCGSISVQLRDTSGTAIAIFQACREAALDHCWRIAAMCLCCSAFLACQHSSNNARNFPEGRGCL